MATSDKRDTQQPGSRSKRSAKMSRRNRGDAQVPTTVAVEPRGKRRRSKGTSNLIAGLRAVADGDLSVTVSADGDEAQAEVAELVNQLIDQQRRVVDELVRISRSVGREGKMRDRARVGGLTGDWAVGVDSVNSLISDLVQPTFEVSRVIKAVAEGDLSQKVELEIEGKQVQGEFFRIGSTVNRMVDQLNAFASEVTRVAREVGTEGVLGGQAHVPEVGGTWADLTDSVNAMASNLTNQVRNIALVTTAVANGDLSQKITVEARGEVLELKNTINIMVEQLSAFAAEVTRVAREVGTEGILGGQANVPGVAGTWKGLTDNVNFMAANLTDQVRNIALVTTAVANGDLSQKISVIAHGEVLDLKDTVNNMVEKLRIFADEVSRVAREVGTEGVLGGQATVSGVAGTWKSLTDNVNAMANNLTNQVRNIAFVTTAVARGDLSQKIEVEARGEVLELKNTINDMVEKLRIFANEVIRVAIEVGTQGQLGGQAEVPGVGGTWKDLTENVNAMAGNLTVQVRNIADVTTAVARGDLSRKITVDVRGEILELKNTVNAMVDQLNAFAGEVTRVAREVGTEGKLGGQAKVREAAGVWRDLTDNVNGLAANLTTQVRNIADVTTAVANGDLSQKITVEAQGEVLSLKMTINEMVDRLRVFADEVTRVAKEVGTEGRLGGQAEVPNVSGTWKGLTDNVNAMANSLTVQVRNIADVTTAVTKGDLTRQITVNARGELDELKQNMNQMIGTLRETTERNQEQDWLKTNLAKFTQMMQGQKDIASVSRLVMNELTPLVSAQVGAFFIMEGDGEPTLSLIASYAYDTRRQLATRFALGRGMVGQAALERKQILFQNLPDDYLEISSGLGAAPPRNAIVLPILFEGQVKAVIELASFLPFSEIHRSFLDQLSVSLGVVLNMIQTSMRTEELLQQSQKLTQELQSSSTELRQQQDELKRSNRELEAQARTLQDSQELLKQQQEELRKVNEELEEKALQLTAQNKKVEQKNREVEASRIELEEKAEQLALSSRYKSEFLANMSHELRTPLNSLLILARLLAENKEGTLSDRQVEFANTIYSSGTDLLNLINDILDLAKVESGKAGVELRDVPVNDIRGFVERTFRPIAEEKGLTFSVRVGADAPPVIRTDQQRLEQVLKNLLSNAIKFTEHGEVTLAIDRAPAGRPRAKLAGADNSDGGVIAFAVHDTGIGIARDKQQLIFEAFQQADGTTSRRYGGTGLGLSISREIAHLLGGEIEVESEPDKGSTFTLYLPVRFHETDTSATAETSVTAAPAPQAEPTPAPSAKKEVRPSEPVAAPPSPAVMPEARAPSKSAPARTAAERPSPTSLTGKHVLIVDDDVRNIFSLTSMLEDRGVEVSFAENGKDALNLLDSTPGIDLVLMDIMMPEMDGHEIIRTIRRRRDGGTLPIIALTAKAMQGDREKAIGAGASDYVAKPVDPARLIAVMEEWVGR
ncbi:MAG TPA: HAMP domain-containing protein [Gemmatimonadaceae bacterium]